MSFIQWQFPETKTFPHHDCYGTTEKSVVTGGIKYYVSLFIFPSYGPTYYEYNFLMRLPICGVMLLYGIHKNHQERWSIISIDLSHIIILSYRLKIIWMLNKNIKERGIS